MGMLSDEMLVDNLLLGLTGFFSTPPACFTSLTMGTWKVNIHGRGVTRTLFMQVPSESDPVGIPLNATILYPTRTPF
jgi:hypothetical protein